MASVSLFKDTDNTSANEKNKNEIKRIIQNKIKSVFFSVIRNVQREICQLYNSARKKIMLHSGNKTAIIQGGGNGCSDDTIFCKICLKSNK